MNLKDLAVNHPYYASEVNFYSNNAGKRWDTMTDFLDEFDSADIDMNLVYRWDVSEKNEDNGYDGYEKQPSDGYYVEVFIIGQRKGIYAPHWIETIEEGEVDRFVEYLGKHKARLMELWEPIQLENDNE